MAYLNSDYFISDRSVMKRQLVKLYYHKDGRLSVVTPDKVERFITIFSGGGYYDDLWLRTQKEIDESIRKQKEQEDKELAEIKKRHFEAQQKLDHKKWYQFWRKV